MLHNPLPPIQPQDDEDNIPRPNDAHPDQPSDESSDGSDGSETDRVEPHGVELTWFDVFALIVNRMVGSGIYNAPSSVLVLTGSKSTAMWLWVAGFVYTVVSMIIYLGYSAVFPYTGGELIYIDEMFSEKNDTVLRTNTGESQRSSNARQTARRQTIWTKVFGDGLLAYTVYAVLFVAFSNSSTNALQVGREILVAIRPEDAPQMDMLRLIAVVALSILCLVQYWSSKAGRRLNRWMARLKIGFLIMILIAGAVRTRYWTFPGNGFVECAPVEHSGIEAAKAMLLVIFSFEGWENATFVAGEIAPGNQAALRTGFISAVAVVGCLYMAIVAVVMYAVPYTPVAIQFAPVLFGNTRASYQAWAVMIAISALGSMNSIIYTFSRIKQCIGVGNIFPYSQFWASDSPDLKNHRNYDSDKSPKGGLWLHWIMSVILIAISAAIPSVLESISLPGLLQTYTHCLILVFISIGALRLPARARNLKPTQERSQDALDWKISRNDWIWRRPLYILVVIYALANLMVVIVAAIRPYVSQDGIPTSQLSPEGWGVSNENKMLNCTSSKYSTSIQFGVPITPGRVSALSGWILPCAAFGTLIMGVAYYFSLFGWPSERSLANVAGVFPKIKRRPKYNFGREEVRRFASRRVITYRRLVRNSKPNFLYWALGGKSQYEDPDTATPLARLRRKKNAIKQKGKAIAMKPIRSFQSKGIQIDNSSEQGGSQDPH